jgi:hypothetical protein
MAAGNSKSFLDEILRAFHLVRGFLVGSSEQVHVAMGVSADRHEPAIDGLTELRPGHCVVGTRPRHLIVDKASGQVEHRWHSVVSKEGEYMLVEIPIAVIEREDDTAGASVGECVIDAADFLTTGKEVKLALERLDRKIDLPSSGTHPVIQQHDHIFWPARVKNPGRQSCHLYHSTA